MSAIETFIREDREIAKYAAITLLGYVNRIAVVSDRTSRTLLLKTMSDFAMEQLKEYQALHNDFLRNSRRKLQFVLFSGKCNSSVTSKILDKIRGNVINFQECVDEMLLSVFLAMTKEAVDDPIFSEQVKRISFVKRAFDNTRNKYLHAYGSMNFIMVLMDVHFFSAIFVKLVRYILVYIVARICRTWFEIRIANDKKDVSFFPFVSRLFVFLGVVDVAIVAGVWGLVNISTGFQKKPSAGAIRTLWKTVSKDFVMCNLVSLVISCVLAQIFHKKTYLRIQSDELVSFQAFFDIIDKVLLINSITPYFMLL